MFKRIRHPSAAQLLQYAESQVDKNATLCVNTASHVASCEPCRTETEAIRVSLACLGDSPPLEPSAESSAQILGGAMAERRRLASLSFPWRVLRGASRGLAYATALAVAAIAVNSALSRDRLPGNRSGIPLESQDAAVFSLEQFRKATPEEILLSEAVMSPQRQPRDAWEEAQRRAVVAMGADIAEALEALKFNPACVRAQKLVTSSRERLKETLKTLYVERSL